MLHYRHQSDTGTNGYLTGGSIGDSIDLFREKDTASESSFGGDDFDTWQTFGIKLLWSLYVKSKLKMLKHTKSKCFANMKKKYQILSM